jgi:putative acetyltransferase
MENIEIRAETGADISAVRSINVAAFGRENEANLVDRLRGMTQTVSFVAVVAEYIVGHIFFSPVAVAGDCPGDRFILGLAPIAVLPDYQRQGIGALLIRHSLAACAQAGCQAVVVLGNPQYYGRFGFRPARENQLRCEYSVPDEAFMVMELTSGGLAGCRGMIKYRPEFETCA